MTNTLLLTKKLVSIPSYVGSDCDEQNIAEDIYQYMKGFKWLKVSKQKVTDGRFNVIAYDKYPTEIIVCNHMDTVQPQTGWVTDPLNPVIKGGNLYGLGSSDTKGNVASILSAIKTTGSTKGVMYLFYVDEEYNFTGMKKFINEYKNRINPKIIASGDGGNLEIGNACRGLIEIRFTVSGIAGHSANPKSGKNSITGSFEAYRELKSKLSQNKFGELGQNTFNLAWIRGGQKTTDNSLGSQGNVIPDFAELVVELRVADTDLNALNVIKMFKIFLKKQGLILTEFKVTHDLGAWLTDKILLSNLPGEKKVFTSAVNRGYVDLQMLWESFNEPVCFTYGAGEPGCAHKANEYVKINKLMKANQFWRKFIQKYAI